MIYKTHIDFCLITSPYIHSCPVTTQMAGKVSLLSMELTGRRPTLTVLVSMRHYHVKLVKFVTYIRDLYKKDKG